MYKIIFYCPDTNFKFDGTTPDSSGMGGGKTALVRMAKALCGLGNHVSVYCNCNEGIYNGVTYTSLEKFKASSCNVFIATTSSKCELAESFEDIRADIKIIWIHGKAFIKGIKEIGYDYIYSVSSYMKDIITSEWELPADKIFVTHNGFSEDNIKDAFSQILPRDNHGIIFASHPSKGLERIIGIVKELRRKYPGFYIDVYGGNKLWGAGFNDNDLPHETFVNFKGLIGQKELTRSFVKYNLMLALSSVPDTSSIAIHEAKKCGVIVIASAVGGNSEIIKDGYDGFLIKEDYLSDECMDKVISIILKLMNDPGLMETLRGNAMRYDRSWNVAAKEWIDHWDSAMKKKSLWNRFFPGFRKN